MPARQVLDNVALGMEIRGTKFETIAFRLSPAAK